MNTFKPKPFKRKIHTAMMVLVEMEISLDASEDCTARAQAILRHKMQTFAATNHDIAVSKMTKRPQDGGYDLEPLP